MERALLLDNRYPATHRDAFCIPSFGSMGLRSDAANTSDFSQVTYLCGNSLGCMPKSTRDAINKELDAWSDRAVESHFRHRGEPQGLTSWVDIDLPLSNLLPSVVGALESEVAVMGSLTANLNALLVAFYRPTSSRFKIICEKGAFPSDFYAFFNQCGIHNIDPNEALVRLEPREGETYLRTDDIIQAISENNEQLALVCLPGIQYYTGQLFDMEKITLFAHQFKNVVVGWDLAHAVGNVPVQLHDWGVDFACWCSYKYLNSGPGAIAGIFVHEKHSQVGSGSHKEDSYMPRLAGWWGNTRERRFQMKEVFEPISGALGFRQSNPSVIDVVALRSSLEIIQDFGGIEALRERSLLLTGYLLELLKESKFYHKSLPSGDVSKAGFIILTPLTESERGAQLSLYFFPHHDDRKLDTMERVSGYLNERGVIVDERRPNVLRIAPAPLYNTFQDVFRAVELLKEALQEL
ncbi:LANO_0G07536g1_1 [Lachancea nothofagi CBS 11611]|uniref:Kynureninase n=1 Tax=Lachancea nothofagi CBS 11611 TaxID=1266666 RepID=A0A1G4KHR4_9SACH|nr:LANO_0G07536g1_1 [Lachancea nothofagi CBS 11611]